MTKLLLINNGYIGRIDDEFVVESGLAEFINDLSDENINVTLFQLYKNITINENIVGSKILFNTLTSEFNDHNKYTKLYSYIKILLKLIYNIRKYDLIYIFLPGHLNYFSLIVSFLLKKKYGIYVRGEANKKLPFFKIISKHAQFIVTNHLLNNSYFASINSDTKLIMSYLNLGNRVPDINHQIIDRSDISGCINLLFVGRIESKKGIDDLINACLLIDKKIDYKLTIVGGGDQFDQYRNIISQDEYLKSRVNLTGFINDRNELSKYYKNNDLFVFPTHEEGFPRVLFDCMINKIPILTTMVGGIPGLLSPNINCLETKLKNPTDLSKKIVYAIDNYDELCRYANKAHESLENYIKSDIVLHKDIISEYFKK